MPVDKEAELFGRVSFRPIEPADKEPLVALHKELFPVPYNDSFFDDLVVGRGINGGKLCTIIAEDNETHEVAGFLFAQMFDYPLNCEDKDMFGYPEPERVCYILTLGTIQRYRRLGLGTALIAQVKDFAEAHKSCGAVYLHVIAYNRAAIAFYERNSFEMLRFLEDFYYFDSQYFSAYLYVYYLPGHQPPLFYRILNEFRRLAHGGVDILQRLAGTLGIWEEDHKEEYQVTTSQSHKMELDSSV